MRPGRRAGVVMAVACAAALSACGSTVTLTGANGGGTGSADGLGTPGSTYAGGNQSSAGAAGALSTAGGWGGGLNGVGGNGSGSSGGSASVTGSAPGTAFQNGMVAGIPAGGGVAPGGGTHAPGVTATTISIGYPYAVNSAAANQAIGGNGITQGNEQGEAQAVINSINRHGGILGRKIVPVWYALDSLSTSTTDSQYQAMCSSFEQDHHVFAIFAGGSQIVEQCAQRAGGVSFWDDLSLSSARTFAQFPSYFEVSMMDLNRIVLNEASGLAAQHYFNPWDFNLSRAGGAGSSTKVGIVTYDSPDFHYAIDSILVPELRQLGHAPDSGNIVYLPEPQRESDVGSLSAETSNAVLKFRTAGIDHVLIVDVSGLITLEFLNNAESQHYFPRYGWSSQNGPQALAGPGDVPKAQLNGSLGIGFDPMLDLPSSANPDNGPYSSTNRRACLALMRANGFTFSDTNSESVALGTCTSFSFFEAALTAGGPTISQANFIAGATRLGYWSGTADGPGNYYGPGQHDGSAYYRFYDWSSRCGCMQYTSGPLKAVGEGER